ncbi:MAG: 4Fe-4S binding protein [Dermatophilaceae bacterium]
MAGVRSGTIILIDPDVLHVGVDPDALLHDLRRLGVGRTMLAPGLARHPELITGAVKACGARRAVVVSAKLGHPPIPELRMWGQAGGLAPLGVKVVALDILSAGRSPVERRSYAVRMVRSAVAALDAPRTARAVRRPIGASLSRRALLNGRATTWVPVVEVKASACLGPLRCSRCVQACPQDAIRFAQDAGASPTVDVSGCEACSACLEVCPTGALSLDGHEPGTLARRLRALLKAGDGSGAPALVIACESAVAPLHRLGEKGGLAGWLVLEVACLGGVGSAWQLAALAAGARTVQLLPCQRCMDRGSATKDLDFTRNLLEALGDRGASQRVGLLPPGGGSLKRAIRAASGLKALSDGTGADGMPHLFAAETPARVAAWATGELQRFLTPPEQVGQPARRLVLGERAPLGVPHIAKGCTGCGVCARNCPNQALSVAASPGCVELVLDPGACTGCGACIEPCPEGVVDVVRGVDLDLLARGHAPIARAEAVACVDCGEPIPALPATAHLPLMPAGLVGRCPRCRQAALVASV